MGALLEIVQKFQWAQNAAGDRDPMSPVLKDLHLLLICFKGQFRVLNLIFKTLNSLGAMYLKNHFI